LYKKRNRPSHDPIDAASDDKLLDADAAATTRESVLH
jgi:hypothetical protein